MKRFAHSLAPVDTISGAGETLTHSDHAVVDGELVWCRSVRALYVYQRGTALTPDGISVVASQFGDGVWVRLEGSSDESWLDQAQWWIDATNGNDENSGSGSGDPIKTWAEMRRRIGPNKIRVACAIHLVTDLAGSDPMIVDFGGNAQIEIVGDVTAARTSTITTFTTRDAATNAPATLDDGAFDWTAAGYISRLYMLTMNNGVASGASAFLVTDVGGGTARVSTFVDYAGTEKTPGNGDSYSVVRLRAVGAAAIQPSLTIGGALYIENIAFPVIPLALRGTSGDSGVRFINCSFGNSPLFARQSAATFMNCRFNGAVMYCCQWFVYGGISFNGGPMNFADGGASVLYGGFLCQGTFLAVSDGAYLTIMDAGAMDFANYGLYVWRGGRAFAEVLWGVSATGGTIGCVLDVFGQLEGGAGDTRYITGAVNDQKIGDEAAGAWPAGAGLTADASTLAAYIHN